MKTRVDAHRRRLEFIIRRINEINAWRNEAIRHAENPKQIAAIEERALALREAAER